MGQLFSRILLTNLERWMLGIQPPVQAYTSKVSITEQKIATKETLTATSMKVRRSTRLLLASSTTEEGHCTLLETLNTADFQMLLVHSAITAKINSLMIQIYWRQMVIFLGPQLSGST